MQVAVHPLANLQREHLLQYGIGYHPLLDFLLIAPDAKGNQLLTDMYVIVPTKSIAIDLLREPYEERIYGIRYWSAAAYCANFGHLWLPRPCKAKFFAELADRWFEECSEYADDLKGERRAQAKRAHEYARECAEHFGPIPDPVLEHIQTVVKELYLKRAGRLH